jgi:hypothetical protein
LLALCSLSLSLSLSSLSSLSSPFSLLSSSLGREIPSEEALPADVPDVPGTIQPGGGVFDKPRRNPIGVDKIDKEGDAKPGAVAIKGVPVSGRVWKLDGKRKSNMFKPMNKNLRKDWEAKMAEKAVKKAVMAKQEALVQARIEERRAKRQEVEDREKRKEANRLKSSVVQAVSTATVRRMSRKQLRTIRKMDVNSEINPAPIKKTKGNKGKVIV